MCVFVIPCCLSSRASTEDWYAKGMPWAQYSSTSSSSSTAMDYELCEALLESTNGQVTNTLLASLALPNTSRIVRHEEKEKEEEEEVWRNSVLVLTQPAALSTPSLANTPVSILHFIQSLGTYCLNNKHFTAVSTTYALARAIDTLFDTLFYTSTTSTSEELLEFALANLLVAVQELLAPVIDSTLAMQNAIGIPGFGTLNNLISQLNEYLEKALNNQDEKAIASLHHNLYQFFEINQTLAVFSKEFIECIQEFQRVKCLTGNPKSLLKELENCSKYAKMHMDYLIDECGVLFEDEYYKQIALLHSIVEKVAQELKFYINDPSVGTDAVHLEDLVKVKSMFSFSFMRLFKPNHANVPAQSWKLVGYPVIDQNTLSNQDLLNNRVAELYESLVGQVVFLIAEAPIEYSLKTRSFAESADTIIRILTAGLGYVAQEDSILGLMGFRRAYLVLGELCGETYPRDPRLTARTKDVNRVLRNVLRDRKVELRINSSFDESFALLSNHHGSRSWASGSLKELWRWMLHHDKLHVFELWVDEELVAADFGHFYAGGSAFYVCTRCYSESYRRIQPGFILAHKSVEYLSERNVRVWDLGDYDGSPQMSYKSSVSSITSRLVFLRVLVQCRRVNYMVGS